MAQSLLYTNNKQTPNFGSVKNANLSNYATPVPTATQKPAVPAATTPQIGTPEYTNYLIQQANTMGVQTTPQVPTTISSESLQNPQQPYNIPPYSPPPTPVPDLSELIKAFNQPSDAESTALNEQNSVLGRIEGLLGTQGTETARRGELETQAGVPDLSKQLNEINAQIRGINAADFQQTQDQLGRYNATASDIYGTQAQIQRQNSARTFGLAAASAALQDNIALANQNVDRAIEAEFGGIESQLKYEELLLNLNRDKLIAAQEKKAQAKEIALNERSRLLEEEKTDRESVYQIMTSVAQNGAPTSAINQIQNARSVSEAISLASPYMQSPEAKYKLESAKLDIELKKMQLATERKQYSLLGAPSASEIKAMQEATSQAQEQLPVIQDKVNLINSLISHKGLDSAVGPSAAKVFSRAGVLDSFTGAKQDFIAGVAQLVNKETIDTLLNLKAKGGTLGALSDQERILLQSAATKIGQWQILKDGQVIGYNAGEAQFIAELNNILSLTKRAQERAIGNLVSPEEKAAINSFQLNLNGSTPATFAPTNYF